jgi:hypothetical protein
VTLVPISPLELFAELAGWQRAVVGPDGDEDLPEPPPGMEVVGARGGTLRVPVPSTWEHLDPLDQLPLLARHPSPEGFAANVTVAVTDPPPPTPVDAATELATGLEGGAVVDAWAHPAAGTLAVVVHPGASEDLVCVQRRLAEGAVTYTCALGQWPTWGPQLVAWAQDVATEGTAP